MKIIESYQDRVSCLHGKKYLEALSFGFDFLSRHQKNCRKVIKTNETIDVNGERIKYIRYEIQSIDVKENGECLNKCKNCGHICYGGAYHFEEDLIKINETNRQ